MNARHAYSMMLVLTSILATTGTEAEARTWLDARPVVNWNKPGGAIPRGPKVNKADLRDALTNCGEDKVKSESTKEARHVVSAGWLGASVLKRSGDIVFVEAANAYDGMCREMDYQDFVFSAGKFIGTISPEPMGSRFDASGRVDIDSVNAQRFTATFFRFGKNDGACCPSRESIVTYEIRSDHRSHKGQYLVPVNVVTKAIKQ